jgi:hypothetical protein
MNSRLRQLLTVPLALIAIIAFAGCSDNSHTKVTTGTYAGESGKNAPYLNVGPLEYQVQLSRQLNPANSEDEGYLQGLTPEQAKLNPGEEWFAVFMQVYNTGESPHPASTNITISDTQGNKYLPIIPDQTNRYAYRAGVVPAGAVLPPPGTTTSQGPTQGALILYKIKTVSLDNRPIEIKILNDADLAESASAELDV